MASVVGGGRQLVVYTMTRGATPSIGATPVFSLTAQIKTTVNVNYTQSHEVDIEHVEDSQALYDFLATYVDTAATSETEEITYEDGTKQSDSGSTSALLVIVRGGLSGSARKIYTAACVIDPTSGAWSQEGNKFSRPKLLLKSVDPLGTVTVPTTYYTGIAVTPAQVTFGLGAFKYGRVTFA
ncbi:MAG: hypothetical protein KatS3mg038_1158 [Candidatus Kapaibacterium sp.]|nr:MAG: hypothetical protein KatS3mg038_1158 [Candidatus Kapabacteria bacterium]